MKFLLFSFLFIPCLVFGQPQKNTKTEAPKFTHLDTVKAQISYDSTITVSIIEDFKNSSFKDCESPVQFDFIKKMIDSYMDKKKKGWENYIKSQK